MKKFYLLSFLLIVLAIAFVEFFYFSRQKEAETITQIYVPNAPNIRIEDRIPPKGKKEYQSRKYRFSLFFPEELSMTQWSEPGEGQTTLFENKDKSKSFQIFVFPYNDTQVSEERFKMDVPSGVMENPLDILVDGVLAKTFSHKNDLGEMLEVWIIKNGFLYEIATFKSQESMLIEIMSSWKFY